MIDIRATHHGEEVAAFGIEHPLGGLGIATFVVESDLVFVLTHEHFADAFNSLQGHVGKHVVLDLFEEDIVVAGSAVGFLMLPLVVVDDADAEDELFGVVVVVDAIEIPAEVDGNVLGYLGHGQLRVDHLLAVELDAQ